jgi:predicted nuclease of predicted toxin-antitoxin system
MKLLVDENLSPKLAQSLADLFPGSKHVSHIGLLGGLDPDVWAFAGEHGFCILTKDVDFLNRSQLLGFPPKVILIRLGNCATSEVVEAVRACFESIREFESDAVISVLAIP